MMIDSAIEERRLESAALGNAFGSGNTLTAAAVAGLVAATLVSTAGEEPLPALAWAAAFLFLAVHQDVSHLKIPNWLTFPALGAALLGAAASGGLAGFATAFWGALAALGILFLPFAAGWLGAGDAKAGAVLGALWGAGHFTAAFWWMVVAGGVMAIALLTLRGGLPDLLCRWCRTLVVTVRTGRLTYFPPSAESPAGAGLPFAVAMGLGAAAYQTWGMPWV